MKCRHCGCELGLPLLDLGCAPPSNAYLVADRLAAPEVWYPLRILVCEACWLVQTEDYAQREELFDGDYAYFSSSSSSWLAHAKAYVEQVTARFQLGDRSSVVEVAANDGYLLQYVSAAGIPCYGIEPTASTAKAARARGIEIMERFFGRQLANELAGQRGRVDLLIGNNVLAHVPDINDFASGVAILLKDHGVATFEFPHLVNLVDQAQFDTVYHEHYSYLSFEAARRVFEVAGLVPFDVEALPTHGGSLRIYLQHRDKGMHPVTSRVEALQSLERRKGVTTAVYYSRLQGQAEAIKDALVTFLIEAKRSGQKVAGYGAAAKGNTLLNFAGVKRDLLPYVCDIAPSKQGKFLPGSRIPILAPEAIEKNRPDFVLILPWNIADEVIEQNACVRDWGGQFVSAVPTLTIQ